MRLVCLLVLSLLLFGCCNPYRAAWVTTAGVREAAFQTESAIAKNLKEKVKSCSQTHAVAIKQHNDCMAACNTANKPDTPELTACKDACKKANAEGIGKYTACVKTSYDANEAWIKYARPSINSALTMTVTSIQLAEASKDKTLPWMQYLMPALCALSEVLQQWKDVLPENVKTMIMAATKFVSAAACKK